MYYEEYGIELLGKDKFYDLVTLTNYLSQNKSKSNRRAYKEKLHMFLSYYEFSYDGEDEYIEADLLLEKEQVVESVRLSKDQVIAFGRSGILVIQRLFK